MRPEGNPLDLNYLPDDYSRDGKHVIEDSSSSAGHRKKKSGGKDEKDENGKVYECRFCSLKFCKSQALGGHMNRHRQERETETLNRARQLVFSNDSLAAQAAHHLGGQSVPHGGYHQTGNMGDPSLSFYSTRLFPGSSSTFLQPSPPPPHQSYIYTSPSRPVSSYPVNDCFVGHVLSGGSNTQYGHPNPNYAAAAPPPPDTNYTCIGAPVGHSVGGGGSIDMSLHNQDEGLNWSRSYTGLTQQNLDPSSINRFQDGF
ncbi:hypothetical protein HYC85_005269 [Camellia sinensis]|uniref:C2H2-type domain-containing protein n=1 Tax=Camellia sinensis TaxID=4442 RepID=A0A7J7I0W6_CAMSI|nr:hypothetical protein HYC85_005269 [Camellia sinensis]